METFAPDTTYRHMKIRIATERPFEFIDVTPDVEALSRRPAFMWASSTSRAFTRPLQLSSTNMSHSC